MKKQFAVRLQLLERSHDPATGQEQDHMVVVQERVHEYDNLTFALGLWEHIVKMVGFLF